jgi:hypothetical protein
MRAFLMAAGAMLAASPALAGNEADIMASRYGNTTDTVDAFGVHTKIWYSADHTYKADSAGTIVTGTWKLKGNKVCVRYFSPPAESCLPVAAHKVGDTWTTGDGALKRTVTLRDGIQ